MGAAGHALTHLQTMDCHHVPRLAAEAQRPESTRVNHRLTNDGIDCSRESIEAAFVDGLLVSTFGVLLSTFGLLAFFLKESIC